MRRMRTTRWEGNTGNSHHWQLRQRKDICGSGGNHMKPCDPDVTEEGGQV